MGWNRGYLIVVGLTVGALLLLSGISFQALKAQGQEEALRELDAARLRAKSAALAYFRELPRRLAEYSAEPDSEHPGAQIIPFPARDEALPGLAVPDSPEAGETFLRVAIASGARRLALLDGFVNAPEPEKSFWGYLLFAASVRGKALDQAARDLERVLRISQDFRLADGFSLKSRGALTMARLLLDLNRLPEARKWLLKAGELPAPRPVPGRLEEFWPSPAERSTAAFVHWLWSASTNGPPSVGWHFHQGVPMLALKAAGTLGGFPGEKPWSELQDAIHEAVGGRFVLTFPETPDAETVPLPHAAGAWIRLTSADAGGASIRPRLRVAFGAVLGVVALGFAFIVLHGMRQSQEERHFRQQEVFFRQAAHDLKTPLTTLRVLAETLELGRTRNDDQKKKYLESIIGEIDRASELVDTMLMTARLRSRVLTPRLERMQPEPVIRRLLARFQSRLEGWTVRVDCPPTLEIRVDPEMWERSLVNMIENVLRHASAGKELCLQAMETEVGVAVRVEDRGPGGKNLPDLRSWQFDVGETSGRQGFGLFLLRMILDLHGGTLSFSERQGGGLRVEALWPVAPKEGQP